MESKYYIFWTDLELLERLQIGLIRIDRRIDRFSIRWQGGESQLAEHRNEVDNVGRQAQLLCEKRPIELFRVDEPDEGLDELDRDVDERLRRDFDLFVFARRYYFRECETPEELNRLVCERSTFIYEAGIYRFEEILTEPEYLAQRLNNIFAIKISATRSFLKFLVRFGLLIINRCIIRVLKSS